MNRIGIIAGGGLLPLEIGKNLLKKNYEIHFFCIKNFANIKLYTNFKKKEIKLNSFSNILKELKSHKIDYIIFAGKILRPSINEIKFDLQTISLIKSFFLESKGDDQLLKTISVFFAKKGFPLYDWKKNCKEMFSNDDNLSIIKPSGNAIKNLNKGLHIFKTTGYADIGQSLIIQNQLLLGIECIEGTDELIKRTAKYKKNGDKGILLKLSKYNQHNELDLPAIGFKTVKNIKKFNYEGIYIEKNKCLILEKEKVVKFCNENKLFLSTINKID